MYDLTFKDLIRAMKMAEPNGRADNANLQGQICEVLWHHSSLDERHRRQAGMAGAVESVTAAMKSRPGNMDVQAMACRALGGLLLEDGENQTKAGQIGTADAVVTVLQSEKLLKRKGSELEIIEAALWALRQFAAHHSGNRKRAGDAGAVEVVVQTMKNNPDSALIQSSACGTMQTLVLNEPLNQDRALAAGAVEVVADAMRTHVRAVKVQDFGCASLQNLAFDHPLLRAKAGDAGAMDVVVSAMRSYQDSKTVQEHGCGAIWNMVTDSSENAARAKASKALDVVIAAIQKFPGNEGVSDHACGALAVLDPPGSRGATAANAIEHGHLGSGDTLHHFFRYTPPRKGFHTVSDAQAVNSKANILRCSCRVVPSAPARFNLPSVGMTRRHIRRALLILR